ncbi:hypothetical protein FDECE_559 [Fusarium decemcellulare]|nr:hypothetical protein FDECE_559 [Fusarium decemcellulare]
MDDRPREVTNDILPFLYDLPSIHELLMLTQSHPALRDVFARNRTRLIWHHLRQTLGPDCMCDLSAYKGLRRAYESLSPSQQRPSSSQRADFDALMRNWARRASTPDIETADCSDLVSRMLSGFLYVTDLINKMLEQMRSTHPIKDSACWPYTLRSIHETGLQTFQEETGPEGSERLQLKRHIYHLFFLAYIACYTYGVRDPDMVIQGRRWFASVEQSEKCEVARIIYRLE